MSRTLPRVSWVLGTVLLAGLTAFVVARLTHGAFTEAEASPPHDDFHRWMHEQLDLRASQDEALHSLESEFEETRENLQEKIRQSGHELAAAVRQGDPESPALARALENLNTAQGALQKATLEHFFAMEKELDPEQAEKLLQWTHDSILGQ